MTSRIIYTAALVWLLGCFGCSAAPTNNAALNVKSPQIPAVLLAVDAWQAFYGSDVTLAAGSEGAWFFDFPVAPGSVHYIQTPFATADVLHSVTITFKVESTDPVYACDDTTDPGPATVHLFFEQQNDGDLNAPDGRWWAASSEYTLGSQDGQTISYTIPFTPGYWSNVEGQQGIEYPQAFAASLANIGWVGMTFGGQNEYGHGVHLTSGSAKYILINYQTN